MSNTIFVDVRMNDMFSGKLQKIGNVARNVFADMARDARKAERKMNDLYHSIDKVSKAMSQHRTAGMEKLGSAVTNVTSKVKSLSVALSKTVVDNSVKIDINSDKKKGGIGKRIAQAASGKDGADWLNMGVSAAMNVGKFAFGQVKDALGAGAKAETTKREFVSQGGKEGGQLYGDVKQFIAGNVLGQEQYGNAQTLMKSGMGAGEVMPAMKMMGDISGGNTEGMQAMTEAFAHMRESGKVTATELNVLSVNGFKPLEEMSKVTGKSVGQLQKDLDGGKVSFDMVKDAMGSATGKGGAFENGLDKAGATPFGKAEIVSGKLQDVQQNAGTALAPAFGSMIDSFNANIMDKVPAWIEAVLPFVEKAMNFIGEMMPGISKFVGAIGTAVKPLADVLFSDTMITFGKNILWMAGKIAEVLGPVIELVSKFLEATIGAVNDAFKTVRGWFGDEEEDDPKPVAAFGAGTAAGGGAGGAWDAQGLISGQPFALGAPASIPTNNIMLGPRKDPFAQKTAVAQPAVTIPLSTTPKPTAASQESSEAITGGCRRVININLNQPMVGKQEFHVGSMQQALEIGLNEFRESYLRVLQGAVASL